MLYIVLAGELESAMDRSLASAVAAPRKETEVLAERSSSLVMFASGVL